MINGLELKIIEGLITVGVSTIFAIGSKVLKNKNDLQLLKKAKSWEQAHKGICLDAVKFAQQAYKDFGGQEKMRQAVNYVTKKAFSQFGVKVDPTVVESDLESALVEAKHKFGEVWSKIPSKSSAVANTTVNPSSSNVVTQNNVKNSVNNVKQS